VTNFIKNTLITITVLPALLLATESNTALKTKNLAIYHTVKGNIEKEYNNLVEKKLKSIGFNLTDAHKRVNDQHEAKWGSTVLDSLSFMPIVRDSTILPLLNIDPRIAGFVPFNLVLHKKLDENVSYVGHLVPEVMLDILGIDNPEVRLKFSASFRALDATIAQELGGHESIIPYIKLPKKTMINYEYTFDTPKDINKFIKKFQNSFELAFIDKGYVISGYYDFIQSTYNAAEILSSYDAFWTYSISNSEFSYNILDNKGARPEAALFAPSTIYMYIKKGTNTLVSGMLRLENWADTLDIKSEKRVKLIQKLDTQIPTILAHLGMKEIQDIAASNAIVKIEKKKLLSNNPTKSVALKEKAVSNKNNIQKIKVGSTVLNIEIPAVPNVINIDSNNNGTHADRSIKFSKRVPPNYVPHSFDKAQKSKGNKNTRIGEVNKGKISAYLRGKFMDADTLKDKLTNAGFKIISSVPVNKKETLTSIVFTNDMLLSLASKEKRGFIASLRALVDTENKTISITNPLYMAKGFLQSDFDEKIANKILITLIDEFPKLTNSKDTLKYQLLSKYQFMNGMPKYHDMIEVASGDNLLEKIKNNQDVVFTQILQNGATLIGIKLAKRTRGFIKKVGRNNAGMLPYPVLIENGKAKILDPKYYISFMYPMLTMSEFMTIAAVPDAMVKDCERVFK